MFGKRYASSPAEPPSEASTGGIAVANSSSTTWWIGYATSLLLTAVLAVALQLLRPILPLVDFPMAYIVAAMAIGYWYGTGPAALCCVTAWLAFVYLSTPPLYTFWPIANGADGWAGQAAFVLGVGIVSFAAVRARRSRLAIAERNERLEREAEERERAQGALRHSEERFRVAQELSPDGFLIFRPLRDGTGAVTDFLWIYENDAASRMNDTNPREVCGKKVSEVLPHHHESPFGKAYKEVAETGEVRVVEEASYEEDTFRQRRWFRVAAVPTAAGDVAILVQDLTERKQAEEALRQSHQTFAELVERAPFGIYIIDSQFRIAHMNVSSQNNAFRNVRPVIGRPLAEAMHILWPDEVAEQIIFEFRHTLETGESYYSPRFTYARHDEEIVESYEWELHRMTFPEGRYGVICYYFDSTELRNAQEALATARGDAERRAEELRVLMDAVPVGVFFADDPECTRITGNPAAQELVAAPPGANISKSAPEEERPTGWQEMKDGVPIPPPDLPMQRAARGETVRNYEMDLVFADGTVKSVLGHASPLRDESGNPRGGVAILVDISELKRAEQRERELEEHKRDFYRRTILAATEGRLLVCEREEILSAVGDAVASWYFDSIETMREPLNQVSRLLQQAGMEEQAIYAFMGCITEGATNVVKHTSGGSMSLHRRDGILTCVFSDSGPGIGAMALPDVALTRNYSTAGTLGMGYKVMMHCADRIYLATGPDGTTLGIEMALKPSPDLPLSPDEMTA